MDLLSEKDTLFCRHPHCHYLDPGTSMIQLGILRLGLKGLDLMLRIVHSPDKFVNAFIHLNRQLCGLKIRHQKEGNTVWPYLEGGTGENVVLLHGFGADKDRLGMLWPWLRRRFHVVIPDLPGFGEHLPDWSADYGIDAQVRRFKRFINAAGLRKFHLMGISLGGYIAGCYAARHPHRVRSLCLMDSAGFSSPVISDAWRRFNTDNRIFLLPGSAQEMQDMVDFLMYRPMQLPATLKMYWVQQVLGQLPWRQKMLDDLLDNGMELMDRLAPQINVPTLVVWGAEDRVCHVSTVDKIMGLIGNCRTYIIKGCGHIPIVEYPALSRKIYMGFLRQIGA